MDQGNRRRYFKKQLILIENCLKSAVNLQSIKSSIIVYGKSSPAQDQRVITVRYIPRKMSMHITEWQISCKVGPFLAVQTIKRWSIAIAVCHGCKEDLQILLNLAKNTNITPTDKSTRYFDFFLPFFVYIHTAYHCTKTQIKTTALSNILT